VNIANQDISTCWIKNFYLVDKIFLTGGLKKNQIRYPDKANRLFCFPNEFNHLMIKFIYVDVCAWDKSAGQTSAMTGIKESPLCGAPLGVARKRRVVNRNHKGK